MRRVFAPYYGLAVSKPLRKLQHATNFANTDDSAPMHRNSEVLI